MFGEPKMMYCQECRQTYPQGTAHNHPFCPYGCTYPHCKERAISAFVSWCKSSRPTRPTLRCHTCHADHYVDEECPKGARNTYTPPPLTTPAQSTSHRRRMPWD